MPERLLEGTRWTDKVYGAVFAGMAGATIGWAATSLTMAGRVSAIEAAQTRIENRLDLLIQRQQSNAERAETYSDRDRQERATERERDRTNRK